MAIFDVECDDCGSIEMNVLLMGKEELLNCELCFGKRTKIMGAAKFKCNTVWNPDKHGSDPNEIPDKTSNGQSKMTYRDGAYVNSKRSKE